LRKRLHQLRRSLGRGSVIRVGPDLVGLDSSQVESDVGDFNACVAAGDHAGALPFYGGELLAGFHLSDAPAFMDWLDAYRLRLCRQVVRSAWSAAEDTEHERGAEAAVPFAELALSFDPNDEAGVRRVMALRVRAGDPGGAMTEYEAFARRLWREHELAPAPETTAAAAALRHMAPGPAVDATPQSASGRVRAAAQPPVPAAHGTAHGAAQGGAPSATPCCTATLLAIGTFSRGGRSEGDPRCAWMRAIIIDRLSQQPGLGLVLVPSHPGPESAAVSRDIDCARTFASGCSPVTLVGSLGTSGAHLRLHIRLISTEPDEAVLHADTFEADTIMALAVAASDAVIAWLGMTGRVSSDRRAPDAPTAPGERPRNTREPRAGTAR
ncbi:MAG TPA: BTAD domain-containing putative transcriptional regulator, partial [Longimicrobiales bacterium]|nr:BTAD domain-containing putative transcriptional regulator [Longimicrobiales bacterium]